MVVNAKEFSHVQQRLISLLADGQCHSGEKIGAHLGVSRAAVWKQLQKLSAFGLDVKSIKGKGYFLPSGIDLLDKTIIKKSLPSLVLDQIVDIEIPFSVSSTNDFVQLKKNSLCDEKGFICLSEFQENGRGRRGRRWVSPLGCNLYLSVLWRFEEGASVLEGLSLAIGVAVNRALRTLFAKNVTLKWPNDILIEEKKLGGILLEMSGDPSGRCDVVMGIGLNIKMPKYQSEIDQPWVSLDQLVPSVSRNQVASAVINEIIPLLKGYPKTGFSKYADEWRAMDAFFGRRVQIIAGDSSTEGTCLGVADNGALILDINGVEKQFYGGEVSLRLSEKG